MKIMIERLELHLFCEITKRVDRVAYQGGDMESL